jgi:hypothetical protein
MVYDMLQSEA